MAETYNSIVIALNKTLVAKIRKDNSNIYLKQELDLLRYCNAINDLFVRLEDYKQDTFGNYLLIMERVYPLQFRALDTK